MYILAVHAWHRHISATLLRIFKVHADTEHAPTNTVLVVNLARQTLPLLTMLFT